MITNKYQHYITACREAGLTNESMLIDVVDFIADLIIEGGCGYGAGYTPDDQDIEAAYERADRIAQHIDGRL